MLHRNRGKKSVLGCNVGKRAIHLGKSPVTCRRRSDAWVVVSWRPEKDRLSQHSARYEPQTTLPGMIKTMKPNELVAAGVNWRKIHCALDTRKTYNRGYCESGSAPGSVHLENAG